MRGLNVCRQCGGGAIQARNAAKARLTEAAAAKAMDTYGLPVEVNPVDALLAEVHRTAGHVAWLGQRIKALQESELVWGKTEQVSKTATEFPGTDTTEGAVPNALLKLYQQERAHLVGVCKTAIAAGLDERRVRLAESQGAMIAQVIRAILGDLDLSAQQQSMVAEVVPRHLRMLAA
jgi:hypothetical protein